MTNVGIMPKKISQAQELKIYKMHHEGLSNSEIARALKINEKTIRNYVGERENDSSKTTTKPKKTHRKPRGAGNPSDPGSEERSRESEHSDQDHHASGEGITFTGGRKTGGNNAMNKEQVAEKQWKCPSCGHEWDGSPDKCPSCGVELERGTSA